MVKHGTLQVRIHFSKSGPKTVKLSGFVSVYKQSKKNPREWERIPGRPVHIHKGPEDVLCQIKNAIRNAKYSIKGSDL